MTTTRQTDIYSLICFVYPHRLEDSEDFIQLSEWKQVRQHVIQNTAELRKEINLTFSRAIDSELHTGSHWRTCNRPQTVRTSSYEDKYGFIINNSKTSYVISLTTFYSLSMLFLDGDDQDPCVILKWYFSALATWIWVHFHQEPALWINLP